ncbi:tRNA G18 (ribose-2'-O)-methylase SpoU [Streptomyces sp. Amel2xB2]|uniref:TrmH family RNA methyltransferase n=1 Tax=Streptomyces sp. Amel2xB2 TaxID=1305829 RepID=UPI000DB9C2BA|nr:TrmH family RNA methyltransferase [Streptomyces sp. Amel2xB2]RAJ66587.1 tRNA G18 (ribose-2'-O)-methylase SpoU [Streptomyces sp. Amel2xB2]
MTAREGRGEGRGTAATGTSGGAGSGTGGGTDAAPLLRRWRRLADGTVLLDGFHALKHAVRFGARVPLALAEDRAAALALAEELAPDLTGTLDGLLREVPRGTLSALVPRPHPTGVAALAVRDDTALPAVRSAPVVVLDEPRHLGNVGAVIRLAAGAGAAGVLTTGTVDPWHPGVVRASAGLHFATCVRRCEPSALPPGPLYALDPEGRDIRGLSLPDDALVAFGSERHGLSDALREHADHLVALPMRAQVSSYNLATSVAMTLYHWMAGKAPEAARGDGA